MLVECVRYPDNPLTTSNTAPGAPRWPSPAYPGLIGNVLPEFLSFSSFPPFPKPESTAAGQPFPSLSETHAYLREFASPLFARGCIRLNTEVQSVDELEGGRGWRVRMRWYRNAGYDEVEEIWDAVVVAVAFYDNPVFPPTPGVDELRRKDLGRHAQGWRGPEEYEGQRILVIGNANSGNDIAAQLAPVAGSVFQSIRRPNFPGFPSLPDSRIARVAPVKEYTVRTVDSLEGNSRQVVDAHLTDQTVIRDLDCVLFGTGYLPFPDFINVLDKQDKLAPLVSTDTSPPRVPSLHRYILYAYNPSLAFVGTAVACYTPFTIADICSTWLGLAWSGAIAYPTDALALLEFEQARLEAVAAGRRQMEAGSPNATEASSLVSYGVLGPFEEEFASALREEVVKARPELDEVLLRWNPKTTAVREAMFDMKRAALERERERTRAAVAR
ncbi:hypothetical protein R3P38DRAFT_3127265 [Favolaschia claudopus]|uniref:Flavin-containing monooxygenase n=1 Tax=Favolaschia claudopus TaxID=2862362 RepID=A0AAV9ZAX0_9AGAR